MRRHRGGAALPLSMVLLPGSAWACGGCTDQLVFSLGWWTIATVGLLLGLVVDASLHRVACSILRIELPRMRLLRYLLGVPAVLILCVMGLGFILAAAVLALWLAVGLARSLGPRPTGVSPRQARVAGLARVLLVGAFMAGHLWISRPSTVPTERMLTAASRFDWRGSWIERELAVRPDAIPAIEARIEELRREHQGSESWREIRFRQLHERLGGPAEFRARFAKQTEQSAVP